MVGFQKRHLPYCIKTAAHKAPFINRNNTICSIKSVLHNPDIRKETAAKL